MTSAVVEPTADEWHEGMDLVARALFEDLGPDDLDLTAVAVAGIELRAQVVARQDGVVCGVSLASLTFESGAASCRTLVPDGALVVTGQPLIDVRGAAADILRAERTALNLLQRLSGTATLTRAFVDAVAGTDAQILDTRKTMPAMRALQRWAVRCGGGVNHRFGLFDEAMLKDNHIAACGGIDAAVARVRAVHAGVRVHVEADTLDQVRDAIAAAADVVLLDNMSLDDLRAAVHIVDGRALTEASGGVDLATVRAIAETGVDRISIGALTHSAPAFDCALDATGTSEP